MEFPDGSYTVWTRKWSSYLQQTLGGKAVRYCVSGLGGILVFTTSVTLGKSLHFLCALVYSSVKWDDK